MLSTTGPGGSFYIFGEQLAPILTKKIGIAVNHMQSAGPIQNVQLLDSGGAQIGIITMGIALQGWLIIDDASNRLRFPRFSIAGGQCVGSVKRRSNHTGKLQFAVGLAQQQNVGIEPAMMDD